MCHLFSISGHAQFSVMNSSFLQALDTDTQGFDLSNELMHNTRYWASGVQQDVDLTLNFHALRPDEENVLKLMEMDHWEKMLLMGSRVIKAETFQIRKAVELLTWWIGEMRS